MKNSLPTQWHSWAITPVLNWFHCQHPERESVWIHKSEIPRYPAPGGICRALWIRWWLGQHLEPHS